MPPPQFPSRSSAEFKRFQSAQMVDAQNHFRRVVKAELQALLQKGVERDIAVKTLLHRIVQCSDEPSQMDVSSVMKQFAMNREDATRALIVKQELGRLKRRGLDPLAAIEELTCKMQGMSPVSPENHKNSNSEASGVSCESTSEVNSVESRSVAASSQVVSEVSNEKESVKLEKDSDEEIEDKVTIVNNSQREISRECEVPRECEVTRDYVLKSMALSKGPASTLLTPSGVSTSPLKRSPQSDVLQSTLKRPLSPEPEEPADVLWGSCIKKLRSSNSVREREETPIKTKRSRSELENASSYEEHVKRIKK